MNQKTNLILEPDAVELIRKRGIEYPRNEFVTSKEGASAAAEKIGYPVVMKIVSPDVIHKSDAGGVVVDIYSSQEAETAFDELERSVNKHTPDADIRGVLVCKQAEPGQEVIIGTVVDDIFGPAVMFGLGGVFVEVLEDVTFRICPIDKNEALEMIREIKGYEILKGARGQAPLDVDGLADLISKVSELAVENQEIQEIDLNPVRVYEDRVIVLDARIIC